jgi:hypothetical protein
MDCSVCARCAYLLHRLGTSLAKAFTLLAQPVDEVYLRCWHNRAKAFLRYWHRGLLCHLHQSSRDLKAVRQHCVTRISSFPCIRLIYQRFFYIILRSRSGLGGRFCSYLISLLHEFTIVAQGAEEVLRYGHNLTRTSRPNGDLRICQVMLHSWPGKRRKRLNMWPCLE